MNKLCFGLTPYLALTTVGLLLIPVVLSVQCDDSDVLTDNSQLYICRSFDGIDCFNVNNPPEPPPDTNFTSSPLQDYLQQACCGLGGGKNINADDPVVSKILHAYEGYEGISQEDFLSIFAFAGCDTFEGLPIHNAVFWISHDDTMNLNADNPYLLQRYALAVIYFSLGGGFRWKMCWSGRRYNASNLENLYEQVDYSPDCDNKHFKGDSWLSGSHECEWAFIECNRDKFVTHLSMPSNILSSGLKFIPFIQSSHIVTTIPPEIGLLDRLEMIDLRNNFITGTIPSQVGSLIYLRSLNLYGNEINGTIPNTLYSVRGMENLTLAKNYLSGEINSAIGEMTHTRSLFLGYNNLQGVIPTELGLLEEIEFVNFKNLQLVGSVPSQICDYSKYKLKRIRVDCHLDCPDGCCSDCNDAYDYTNCAAKDSQYSWFASDDNSRQLSASSEIVGCDWLELRDNVFCPEFRFQFENNDNVTASKGCCYCGGCEDFFGWTNKLNDGCDWFEENEVPTCPHGGFVTDKDDRVSANEACCWCGGGVSANFEAPSASPTTSFSPSSSFEKDLERCTNLEGFVDSWGDNCTWYELNDELSCPGFGQTYDQNAVTTAWESCCWCGGGEVLYPSTPNSVIQISGSPSPSNIPSRSFHEFSEPPLQMSSTFMQSAPEDSKKIQGLSPKKSQAVTNDFRQGECRNFPQDWTSVQGFNITCDWFEEKDYRCVYYSHDFHDQELIFASDSCCICGGGVYDQEPSTSPVLNNVSSSFESCTDVQLPRPRVQHDCDWFYREPDRCDELGSEVLLVNYLGEQITANQACCVCGGGTSDCEDFPDWIDSHHSHPYTCYHYDIMEACDENGGQYINFGHTATSSCCVCGGGIVEDVYRTLVSPSKEQQCFDEHNWYYIAPNGTAVTCDRFRKSDGSVDIELCLSVGHFSSDRAVNASDACCDCHYGYDDDGGNAYVKLETFLQIIYISLFVTSVVGGYTGALIGKVFRVGLLENEEIDFAYSFPEDAPSDSIAEPGGIMYGFIKEFASFHGLGLSIFRDINNGVDLSCIDQLNFGLVDICLGPYWNISEVTSFSKVSRELYIDEFYLVQRLFEMRWLNLSSLVFTIASFTPGAWILIFSTITIFAVAIDYMKFGFTLGFPSPSRLFSSLYLSFILFIGKRPVLARDGGEMMATLGFAIFCLFVVTLFTGAITAAIVTYPGLVKFKNLDDVINSNRIICTFAYLEERFLDEHPGAADLMSSAKFFTSTDLLDALRNSTCDVAVISNEAFQSATRINEKYCDELVILLDQILLEVEVFLPIGPSLGSLGDEFLTTFDYYVEQGWFTDAWDEVSENYEKCDEKDIINDNIAIKANQILFPTFICFMFICAGLRMTFRGRKTNQLSKETNENTLCSQKSDTARQSSVIEMSGFALFSYLSSQEGTDREKLAKAFSALPDKTMLLELAFNELDDDEPSKLHFPVLSSLSVEDISHILMNYLNNESFDSSINESIEDAMKSSDQRTSLLNVILHSDELTNFALTHIAKDDSRLESRNSNHLSLVDQWNSKYNLSY